MISPSQFVVIPVPTNLDKLWQAHLLLMRNKRYMESIANIRKKYDVGTYAIDTDTPFDIQELRPDNPEYQKDIQLLANSIRFPGAWDTAVEEHVLGFDPETCLFPSDSKRIIARKESDCVTVKLYGDITQSDLRFAAPQIRSLIDNSINPDRSIKLKSRLDKNLLIYELWANGMSYAEIAKYCNDNGVQSGLSPEDVSKYLQVIHKQIEEIFA